MLRTTLHGTPGKHNRSAADERLTRGMRQSARQLKPAVAAGGNLRLRWSALVLLSALASSPAALAQQKTGPGVPVDDRLTWNGITLYGVIDIGVQYDTHSAPFTPYRPSASGNIVRQNSHQSVLGLTPSNMGQSRVGLQGDEPLGGDWSAIFQVETFFNPQSGEIADSLKSLPLTTANR